MSIVRHTKVFIWSTLKPPVLSLVLSHSDSAAGFVSTQPFWKSRQQSRDLINQKSLLQSKFSFSCLHRDHVIIFVLLKFLPLCVFWNFGGCWVMFDSINEHLL